MIDWYVPGAATLAAAIVSAVVGRVAITRSPRRLARTNVDGAEVPAVLGWAVVAGAVAAAATIAIWILVSFGDGQCPADPLCHRLVMVGAPWELVWVPLLPILGMFAAGTWDDLRGDERPRGFGGHMGALRGGAVTGGLVKLVAGALVGLVTIAALNERRIPEIDVWLLAAAAIALMANLINLLDRAPGRASKVVIVLGLPLLFVDAWPALGAGMLGSAIGTLSLDLRARGMLGDAGANPLGAVLGLGAVIAAARVSFDPALSRLALAVLVVVLLGLNLASEKWSFSSVIDNTPWLARMDHLGRK